MNIQASPAASDDCRQPECVARCREARLTCKSRDGQGVMWEGFVEYCRITCQQNQA